MANHKILIAGIDGNHLILTVNGKPTNNLNVNPSDKVTWKIDKKSGVKSISEIEDISDINVFSKGPKKRKKSSSWRGTIDPEIKVPSEELYNIKYKPKGSKEILQYDPKISVNN